LAIPEGLSQFSGSRLDWRRWAVLSQEKRKRIVDAARAPLRWAGTQQNLALVYRALCDKDHQPRHLDDALEAVDGALEEFRKANAAFYIAKAERQREKILAAEGK
jgi:hypothetical protein